MSGSDGEQIPSNFEIAGGDLDRSVPGADVYLAVPRAAAVPPGKACQIAKRYVDLVNDGASVQIAELFEADAVLLDQIGKNAMGQDQIEAYFVAIGHLSPRIVAVAYTGDDVDCMAAIATEMTIKAQSRWVLTSVDHFTLGSSGKVSRLVAFGRPFGAQLERSR